MQFFKWKPALSGGLAGAINGLLGAGGGMILVPMLGRFCGIKGKAVFATSISIILPISLVSLFVLNTQSPLPWLEALPYLIGGALGGILGGILFKRVTAPRLHRILGGFILWGGLQLLL